MFKKSIIFALIISMLVLSVGCNKEEAQINEPTPSEITTPTLAPTPSVDYVTDDELKATSLKYDTLISDAKAFVKPNVEEYKFDLSIPASSKKFTAQFNLLTENALLDCDVLGYNYVDKDNKSVLEASYKEYDGVLSDVEFSVIKLCYKLAVTDEAYALKLIKRDVNTLIEFASDGTALEDSAYTEAISGLKTVELDFTENVKATFSFEKIDNVLYYNANIEIK